MSVPGTDLQGWRWVRGRASRRAYWLWAVVILTWAQVFAAAGDELPLQILGTAFWLQVIRRLHDAGHSGWWLAGGGMAAVALAGVASAAPAQSWLGAAPTLFTLGSLIAVGILPGSRGDNRFGPPPRPRRERPPAARDPIQA
jgi:uncharacterized membrane protein YhaH (DUF805 family)